jgi:hypothetical protein
MRVAPEIIAGFCRIRSRDLLQPRQGDLAALDPSKLLWAFAGVESSFGQNSHPRHEQGYCYNGRYFQQKATEQWGCLAHCSYGPWQVMFDHFPNGVTPIALLPQGDGHVAADLSAMACVAILNQALARGAKTLTDLAMAYNGPADTPEYMRQLLASYDRPMPQYTDPVLA